MDIRVSLQVFGRRWLFRIKGVACLAGGNYPISGWKGGFLGPERLPLSGFSENRDRPASLQPLPHHRLENTRKGRSSSPLLAGQIKKSVPDSPRFVPMPAFGADHKQSHMTFCTLSCDQFNCLQPAACLTSTGKNKTSDGKHLNIILT